MFRVRCDITRCGRSATSEQHPLCLRRPTCGSMAAHCARITVQLPDSTTNRRQCRIICLFFSLLSTDPDKLDYVDILNLRTAYCWRSHCHTFVLTVKAKDAAALRTCQQNKWNGCCWCVIRFGSGRCGPRMRCMRMYGAGTPTPPRGRVAGLLAHSIRRVIHDIYFVHLVARYENSNSFRNQRCYEMLWDWNHWSNIVKVTWCHDGAHTSTSMIK